MPSSHNHRESSLLVILLLLVVVTLTIFRPAAAMALAPPSPASAVVYGPQSRALLLLVSKLAAKEGISTSCICAPDTEDGCRRLMYGVEYANANANAGENLDLPSEQNYAKPISDAQDMQTALEAAESMVLIGHDAPVEPSTLETFLKYTNGDKLQKLVLISKMGVTTAGNSRRFFGGSGNAAWLQSEQEIAKLASQNNLMFSIIRAGLLKGGGPGETDGNSFGLDKAYYNTLFDIIEAKVTMAHDKFTLGIDNTSIQKGDPHQLPNTIQQMGGKSSFDPSPTDSNRGIVAAAAVAALKWDKPLELSVGSAAGKVPPTSNEWVELLEKLSS